VIAKYGQEMIMFTKKNVFLAAMVDLSFYKKNNKKVYFSIEASYIYFRTQSSWMAERLATLPATQVARVCSPVPARPTFIVEKGDFFFNPASVLKTLYASFCFSPFLELMEIVDYTGFSLCRLPKSRNEANILQFMFTVFILFRANI
jgi:hypothetical protein